MADTVRKELSALRGFISWASDPSRRKLPPGIVVPSVPKRAVGRPHPVKRRQAAIELSASEVQRLIAALPVWSRNPASRKAPFPIRARFIVAYETSLRPGALDALEFPKHYRPGSGELRITADLDKVRKKRIVKISAAAAAALDEVIPAVPGPIFGARDYRHAIKKAALAVLPPGRAEAFCAAHLRSARITHWLDRGGAVTGIQWQAGLKRVETVTRYARASQAAGDALIAAFEAPPASDP